MTEKKKKPALSLIDAKKDKRRQCSCVNNNNMCSLALARVYLVHIVASHRAVTESQHLS